MGLNPYMCSVYIVKNENGLVKIGFSKNPKTRINNIQTQSGYEITNRYISKPCINYREIERQLHGIYSKQRLRGEWFEIDIGGAIEKIKSLDLKYEYTKEEEIIVIEKNKKRDGFWNSFKETVKQNGVGNNDLFECFKRSMVYIYNTQCVISDIFGCAYDNSILDVFEVECRAGDISEDELSVISECRGNMSDEKYANVIEVCSRINVPKYFVPSFYHYLSVHLQRFSNPTKRLILESACVCLIGTGINVDELWENNNNYDDWSELDA